MKVLIAGATGALGVPLTRQLIAAGHEVTGITRSEAGAGVLWDLGASSVVVDALDRDALLRAVDGRSADVVVHQLTALKKPPMRHRDLLATNALRIAGTANLLAAADAVGARRFVTQSFFGGYGFGDGSRLVTEQDRFAPPGGGKFDAAWQAMASTEQQVLDAPGIDGVALRYGGFYGPTSIAPMLEALRRRRLPVPRGGGGYVSVVYIDDAAAATVLAVDRGEPNEVYNIVDDEPVRWGVMIGAVAEAFGAPKPRALPGAMLRMAAPYAGVLMTRQSLRLSNAKAKERLGWHPSAPTYRDGIAAAVAALTRPEDIEDGPQPTGRRAETRAR